MKINFSEVNGHVGIDDRYSFREATTGFTLETEGKPYIILVAENSSARLIIGSEQLTLPANSVMHINYPRPTPLKQAAKNLRLLSGKLWAMIDRKEWKPETGNSAVGVRG